ncbi:hypothetical protein [Enterococcus villorum]|uniref:hypothetical protein n=1 Tax=Enterococcus villorum TaxID=112904 RepID=UPI001177E435|nr:hypothetical protein [Enterococcus villorum]
MNEKNYINSLVKTGEMNYLKATEYTNEYDKLINQFEKLSKEFDVDNRRNIIDKLLKQYFPNFTPTTVMNKTTTESPTTSTPETYIRRRNKMLISDLNRIMEEINGLRDHVSELINQLNINTLVKKTNPEAYKFRTSVEVLNAKIDDAKNIQLPKLEYERGLIQSQIMNEKNYISSLVKGGKINFSEAEEYRNEYDKLINQFEKPIHDFNIDNAREKIDNLVKQSLSKYTSIIAESNKSTTEKFAISTSETYIRRRNDMLKRSLSIVRGKEEYLVSQTACLEKNLSLLKTNPETKLSVIEKQRAQIDEIRNNQLPRLNYERGLVQYQIMNEKNYISSLVKEGKMSDVEAEEYRNEYNKLINQFEKPILDNNIDNESERMDSLVKQSHSKYAPTTESPTTATPERTTTATPETNIRKRIKKLESGSDVIIKNIMALRRQVNDIEKRLIAEKKNPNHSRFSIENLTMQRDNIKGLLQNFENQRTDCQTILIDERNSIESLVKEGKISAVQAEVFINKYNEIIDKCKQPIPDINMDNSTTTTERSTTTTTEAPTIFKPEEYIRRRNKVLELQFDMVIQEITYLSNKANEIEDMLFLKEQFPDLTLPNSIDVLRAQRDEIRDELLSTLGDQRDFVQYQIMNEKDAIESLVKEGKMSAVEAEKYRNEYNKLMNKFEVPLYDIVLEINNGRKKRDLSVKQRLSEKLASTATDNKEKPRLAEKLASIATNNKEKLEKLSVMKREPAMVR